MSNAVAVSEGIAKRQRNLVPFKPGESGNPNGRPKGSRNKLGEDFILKMQEAFQEHGKAVIQTVIEERPHEFLKVIASLLPKEFHITDATVDGLSDHELGDIIDAVRVVASERHLVRQARASRAKVIEGTKAPEGNTEARE